MYHIFFIHSSVDGHLGCFHILAIINNAAMNIGVHVSFRISVLSGYMPSSVITESYGTSAFGFLRKLHTVFHSDYINLHSHQQCTIAPISPHPCQHLLCLIFSIITILTGMRWYLNVVLICISFMTGDVEHFFMYMLVICTSSLGKMHCHSTRIEHLCVFILFNKFLILCIPWIQELVLDYFLSSRTKKMNK